MGGGKQKEGKNVGWKWEGVPLPRVLDVHSAGLTETSLSGPTLLSHCSSSLLLLGQVNVFLRRLKMLPR